MEKSKYWSLKVQGLPSEFEDNVSDWFFENGAGGVQQDLAFAQTDKRYLPNIQEQTHFDLMVYFEAEPPAALKSEFYKSFPELASVVTLELVAAESLDWQEEWKKNWAAFCLVEKYWVVPSWLFDRFDEPGAKPIRIDPGMAFGTGTHATTQLASQLIFGSWSPDKYAKAVDVGTGSGILAILMDKLKCPSVTAYDNDEHAERVFSENKALNGASSLSWRADWSEDTYDLVVANIIDGVLIDLKSEFQKSLPVGGDFIVTGILKERAENFMVEMNQGWDLEIITTLDKEEWVGIHYRRRA